MTDLDRYTRREITRLYQAAVRDETLKYVAKALWRDAHPETGALDTPDYLILTAAAGEACELRRALSAELDRRDEETVRA